LELGGTWAHTGVQSTSAHHNPAFRWNPLTIELKMG
jgi:hypothetical protein